MQNLSVGIALTSALRNVGPVVASKTASLILRVVSTANNSANASVQPGAAKDLADVVRLAGSVIQKFATAKAAAADRRATAEEKAESAKVFGIIAAVVMVVVAVVLAAFTFGAGGALVSLAVIAAAAIIGSATAVANAAVAINHPLAPALQAALAKVSDVVQAFEREHAFDAVAARRRALAKIMEALRSLEALALPVSQLTGPCQADPQAALLSGQQANKSLAELTASLRRTGLGSNSQWLAAIAALERLQVEAAQALASANSRPGLVFKTPGTPGPVPIPYPNTTNTK